MNKNCLKTDLLIALYGRLLEAVNINQSFKANLIIQYTRSQIKGIFWILLLLRLEHFILVNRNLW